ncbi:MAG: P-II family nitrogen regulator [Gemmatimonadaceae bacterium]
MHDLTRLDEWTGSADDLWLITAIVQPFKLEALALALDALPDFGGMTVSDCRGFGRNSITSERVRSADEGPAAHAGRARPVSRSEDEADPSEVVEYSRKARLDIAVPGKARALRIARTIARAAHTGRSGDGKVLLSPLAGVVGVRGFDVDHDAL